MSRSQSTHSSENTSRFCFVLLGRNTGVLPLCRRGLLPRLAYLLLFTRPYVLQDSGFGVVVCVRACLCLCVFYVFVVFSSRYFPSLPYSAAASPMQPSHACLLLFRHIPRVECFIARPVPRSLNTVSPTVGTGFQWMYVALRGRDAIFYPPTGEEFERSPPRIWECSIFFNNLRQIMPLNNYSSELLILVLLDPTKARPQDHTRKKEKIRRVVRQCNNGDEQASFGGGATGA